MNQTSVEPAGFVDTVAVPTFTLASGATIPAIGLGTFGSDRFSMEEIAAAAALALRTGYRLVDCASVYANEDLIGPMLATTMDEEGIARDELFVISKVWNDAHAPADAVASVKKSLADLRLDYLDALFIHWPFPNTHERFAAPDARNPSSRPYIHAEFMAMYRALEDLVDSGLIRHLGVSNVTIPKLRLILRDARIAPALHEMELHPAFQQGELYQFSKDRGMVVIGYSPMGSPRRPERDRFEGDVSDMEHPVVVRIAAELGVHPAEVCLKWAAQRGHVAIPFSVKPAQILSNLRCVTERPLTPAMLNALRGVESNSRLIKGQVFLWEGSDAWLDLWDVDGTIPGWTGYGSTAAE
jgi:diketogulonate reductase-like aldo/keto reductase